MKKNKDISDKVLKLFNLGVGLSDICELCDITIDELHDLCKTNSDIKIAKDKGIMDTNLKIINALLKAAIGYKTSETITEKKYAADGKKVLYKSVINTEKEYGPNASACKFWLENRSEEWKESLDKSEKELNITVSVDGKDVIVNKK